MDPEETIDEQQRRMPKYKEDGDRHFVTEHGRVAEITIDLVLQARAKMSENKVNGPEDSIVSEMNKQWPQENIYEITRCLQDLFVKLVFLRKTDGEPKKR